MKLYFQSTRNSQITYTAYDGMDEATIRGLMEEIGHTDIITITEEDYSASQPII